MFQNLAQGTLDEQNASEKDRPLSEPMLREHFEKGCKKDSELKVGVEWEKLGVCRQTATAIPYSGPRGVEAILNSLIRKYGWQGVFSDSKVIALKKGCTWITLEPGGQIELSGWKAMTIDQNASELYAHLTELKDVSGPLGVVWLGLGAQPISRAEEMEWVPKRRYAIMREALKGRGELTYSMMKETASVQISIDYTSQADAAEKFRLAMALAPFFSAIFANSPFAGGRLSGFLSRRAHIWARTAPERTGILWKTFDRDFGFDDYVRYALDVPVLFLVRDQRWIPVQGLTFGQYLKKGYGDYQATQGDWELHLTGIFTEARLKRYIEIRSIDCQSIELGLAAVALLKGIFYDGVSRNEAWKRVADLSIEERKRLSEQVPLKALNTPFKGGLLCQTAMELCRLGEQGLQRLAQTGLSLPDEARYLKPLKTLLEKGQCPAEAHLKRLGAQPDSKVSAAKIVELAAI